MVEILVMPERWRLRRGGGHEAFVFGVGNLSGGEEKSVDPDAVDGAFAILTGGGTHEEPGFGDGDQLRLDWRRGGLVVGMGGCHGCSLNKEAS
jgi:hypothetical protein